MKRRSDAAMRLSVVSDSETVAGGLISLSEAAKFLGVSLRTVNRLVSAKGELASVKVRGRRMIPQRALNEYVAAGLVRQDKAS